MLGHLLYGLLIGAIALFAASISDSAATAAIITLAVTIGSWVLDFAATRQSGIMSSIAISGVACDTSPLPEFTTGPCDCSQPHIAGNRYRYNGGVGPFCGPG
jgi:hypothetical protein